MKYDLTKKPTRGAQRTLAAFSSTLFELIAQKPFEEVNVNEICERSNYPRATFYNYFDDKFDLLNYCFYILAKEIRLDEFKSIPVEDLLPIYFERGYDLFEAQKAFLTKVLNHNNINSTVITNFTIFLRQQMRTIFFNCLSQVPQSSNPALPIELMADHYTNTILLILEWIFFKKNNTTKIEAQRYLDVLLKNI